MAINKLRHLQLIRNAQITNQRAAAKAAAEAEKASLKDGEIIAARYLISGTTATSANTAVAIGHKVGSGSTGYIVFNDPQEIKEMVTAATASTENLEKAVGVAHGESAITFNNDSKYIGTSNSASGAIQTLDTKLAETSGKVENLESVVGVASTATTLGVNGHYVTTGDTVKDAVTDLDSNLYTVSGKTDSGITAFNNYTTNVIGQASGSTGLGATGSNITATDTVQSAVEKLDAAIESGDTANDNLRQAVGAAVGASTMSYPNTNYIVSDTTVSGALVTLDSVEKATRDTIGGMSGSGSGMTNTGTYISGASTVASALTALDTNLETLSGQVTANHVVGSSSISAATANTGTTLSVILNNTLTDAALTGQTGSTAETNMHKNILSATTTGLVAISDLHYDAATNKLTFVNTNGARNIQLTGMKALSSATYNATTESIDLVFELQNGTTSSMSIPVSGIVEEYQFNDSDEPDKTSASSSQHNVSIVSVRDVPGKTQVYAELSVYDCGTY